MACSDIENYDLSIYKGDDKTFAFRFKAADVPVNITGYTIVFECEEASLTRDAVIVDALDGRYDVVFTPIDTDTLAAIRVEYEVVYWPTGLLGTKETKHRGTLYIEQEVTP